MPTTKLRVGIVGSGFITEIQVPGFQYCPEFEVVAVCGPYEVRAASIAERFNIPHRYTRIEDMLADDDKLRLDVVSIASPPAQHFPMVRQALTAGKHVLCEKPFATNIIEAQAMLKQATKVRRIGMVDYEFRLRPARLMLKRLLDEGYVGRIYSVAVHKFDPWLADPASPYYWLYDRSRAGGILNALGSHFFDSLLWWIGGIDRVSAMLDTQITQRPMPAGGMGSCTADDGFAALVRFKNGAEGVIQINAASPVDSLRVEIIGSDGMLVLVDDVEVWGSPGRGRPLVPSADLQPRVIQGDARFDPFVELLYRFKSAIDTGEVIWPSFADGLRCQAVLDAVRQADAEQRWVDVPTVS